MFSSHLSRRKVLAGTSIGLLSLLLPQYVFSQISAASVSILEVKVVALKKSVPDRLICAFVGTTLEFSA